MSLIAALADYERSRKIATLYRAMERGRFVKGDGDVFGRSAKVRRKKLTAFNADDVMDCIPPSMEATPGRRSRVVFKLRGK